MQVLPTIHSGRRLMWVKSAETQRALIEENVRNGSCLDAILQILELLTKKTGNVPNLIDSKPVYPVE